MLKDNRIYVFKDILTNKEKECSYEGALSVMQLRQYLDDQPRFRFLRSFVPKVITVKKIRRSDGQKKIDFEKITKVEETDVSTIRPRLDRKEQYTKLPTTWLAPLGGSELAESPLKRRE